VSSMQKVCPNCRTPAPIAAAFCGQCQHQFRTQFQGDQTVAMAPPPPPPTSPSARTTTQLSTTKAGPQLDYRKWNLVSQPMDSAERTHSFVWAALGAVLFALALISVSALWGWQVGLHVPIPEERTSTSTAQRPEPPARTRRNTAEPSARTPGPDSRGSETSDEPHFPIPVSTVPSLVSGLWVLVAAIASVLSLFWLFGFMLMRVRRIGLYLADDHGVYAFEARARMFRNVIYGAWALLVVSMVISFVASQRVTVVARRQEAVEKRRQEERARLEEQRWRMEMQRQDTLSWPPSAPGGYSGYGRP
jgi:hypothetical protein